MQVFDFLLQDDTTLVEEWPENHWKDDKLRIRKAAQCKETLIILLHF